MFESQIFFDVVLIPDGFNITSERYHNAHKVAACIQPEASSIGIRISIYNVTLTSPRASGLARIESGILEDPQFMAPYGAFAFLRH